MSESFSYKAAIVQVDFSKRKKGLSSINAFEEFKELVISSGADIFYEDLSNQYKPDSGLFITK